MGMNIDTNMVLFVQRALNVVAVLIVLLIINETMKYIKKTKAEWRVAKRLLDIRLVPYDKVRIDDTFKDIVPDAPDMIPDSKLDFFVIMVWSAITSKGFSLSVPTVYNKETDQYIVVKNFYRYIFFKDVIKTKRILVIVSKSKEQYWENNLEEYQRNQEY